MTVRLQRQSNSHIISHLFICLIEMGEHGKFIFGLILETAPWRSSSTFSRDIYLNTLYINTGLMYLFFNVCECRKGV